MVLACGGGCTASPSVHGGGLVREDLFSRCNSVTDLPRAVRPLTSLVPPIVALAITALCAVTLNANKGHPSSDIRPTSRQKLATAFLALTCLLAAAYLITEQVIGWQVSWAPRAFEGWFPAQSLLR